MGIFSSTGRRFDRKSDYTFSGNRQLQGRAKPSIDLVAADRDRRDGTRRGREHR